MLKFHIIIIKFSILLTKIFRVKLKTPRTRNQSNPQNTTKFGPQSPHLNTNNRKHTVRKTNKKGRKKEKEGRGFGRLPSFFSPPFLFVFLTVCFLVFVLRCCDCGPNLVVFWGFDWFRVLGVFNCALVWTLRRIRVSGDTGSCLKFSE